jgi:succinate dehydrogenase flavin-adding protein (antitoxin of CptAB toxin-antitoxin module)
VSNNWSSFEKDQLLMESWRGHLEKEIVLEEFDQMLLDEGLGEQLKGFIQQTADFFSKLWNNPEFQTQIESAEEFAIKTKEQSVGLADQIEDSSMEWIGKYLIGKLKKQKKSVNEDNLFEVLSEFLQVVFKKGALMARSKLAVVTGGVSEPVIRGIKYLFKDRIATTEDDFAKQILKRILEQPEVIQAMQDAEAERIGAEEEAASKSTRRLPWQKKEAEPAYGTPAWRLQAKQRQQSRSGGAPARQYQESKED